MDINTFLNNVYSSTNEDNNKSVDKKVITPDATNSVRSYSANPNPFTRGYDKFNVMFTHDPELTRFGITQNRFDDIQRELINRQSTGEKIRNSAIRTVTDTLLDMGTAFTNFPTFAVDGYTYLFGSEEDKKNITFSNPIGEYLTEVRENLDNEFRIYRDPNRTILNGGMSDAAWWLDQFPSVFSSLSMMIPARLGSSLVMKSTSLLGKTLRTAAKGINASRRAKLASDVIEDGGRIARAAARGTEATENLSWTQKLFSFSNRTKLQEFADIGLSGIFSRGFENYQEAHGVYNQAYDLVSNYLSGLKENEFAEWKEKNGIDANADINTVAKEIASKSANENFKDNIANVIFDIWQFAGLKSMWRVTGATKATPALKQTAREVADNIAGKTAAVAGTTGSVAASRNMAARAGNWLWNRKSIIAAESTEGVEEMVNYVAEQEGMHIAKVAIGKEEESPFYDRLGTYIKDGNLWDSAFWGFLGGILFATGGNSVMNKLKYGTWQDIQTEQRKASLQSLNVKLNTIFGQISTIEKENKNPFNNFKQFQDDNEKNRVKNELIHNALIEMGLEQANNGNIDLFRSIINDEGVRKKFVEKGLITEDGQNEWYQITNNIIDRVQQEYENEVKQITNLIDALPSDYDKTILPQFINIIANDNIRAKFGIESLETDNRRLQSEIDEILLNSEEQNWSELNTIRNVLGYNQTAVKIFGLQSQINKLQSENKIGNKHKIELLEKQLNNLLEGNYKGDRFGKAVSKFLASKIYDVDGNLQIREILKDEQTINEIKEIDSAITDEDIDSIFDIYRTADTLRKSSEEAKKVMSLLDSQIYNDGVIKELKSKIINDFKTFDKKIASANATLEKSVREKYNNAVATLQQLYTKYALQGKDLKQDISDYVYDNNEDGIKSYGEDYDIIKTNITLLKALTQTGFERQGENIDFIEDMGYVLDTIPVFSNPKTKKTPANDDEEEQTQNQQQNNTTTSQSTTNTSNTSTNSNNPGTSRIEDLTTGIVFDNGNVIIEENGSDKINLTSGVQQTDGTRVYYLNTLTQSMIINNDDFQLFEEIPNGYTADDLIISLQPVIEIDKDGNVKVRHSGKVEIKTGNQQQQPAQQQAQTPTQQPAAGNNLNAQQRQNLNAQQPLFNENLPTIEELNATLGNIDEENQQLSAIENQSLNELQQAGLGAIYNIYDTIQTNVDITMDYLINQYYESKPVDEEDKENRINIAANTLVQNLINNNVPEDRIKLAVENFKKDAHQNFELLAEDDENFASSITKLHVSINLSRFTAQDINDKIELVLANYIKDKNISKVDGKYYISATYLFREINNINFNYTTDLYNHIIAYMIRNNDKYEFIDDISDANIVIEKARQSKEEIESIQTQEIPFRININTVWFNNTRNYRQFTEEYWKLFDSVNVGDALTVEKVDNVLKIKVNNKEIGELTIPRFANGRYELLAKGFIQNLGYNIDGVVSGEFCDFVHNIFESNDKDYQELRSIILAYHRAIMFKTDTTGIINRYANNPLIQRLTGSLIVNPKDVNIEDTYATNLDYLHTIYNIVTTNIEDLNESQSEISANINKWFDKVLDNYMQTVYIADHPNSKLVVSFKSKGRILTNPKDDNNPIASQLPIKTAVANIDEVSLGFIDGNGNFIQNGKHPQRISKSDTAGNIFLVLHDKNEPEKLDFIDVTGRAINQIYADSNNNSAIVPIIDSIKNEFNRLADEVYDKKNQESINELFRFLDSIFNGIEHPTLFKFNKGIITGETKKGNRYFNFKNGRNEDGSTKITITYTSGRLNVYQNSNRVDINRLKSIFDNWLNNTDFTINTRLLKADGTKSLDGSVLKYKNNKFVINIGNNEFIFDSYEDFLIKNNLITADTHVENGSNYGHSTNPNEVQETMLVKFETSPVEEIRAQQEALKAVNQVEETNAITNSIQKALNDRRYTNKGNAIAKVIQSYITDVSNKIKSDYLKFLKENVNGIPLLPKNIIFVEDNNDETSLEYKLNNTHNSQGNLIGVYAVYSKNLESVLIGKNFVELIRTDPKFALNTLVHEQLHARFRTIQDKNDGSYESLLDRIENIYNEFAKHLNNQIEEEQLKYEDYLISDEDLTNKKYKALEEFLIRSITDNELASYLNEIESKDNTNVNIKKKSVFQKIIDWLIKFFDIDLNKKSLLYEEYLTLSEILSNKPVINPVTQEETEVKTKETEQTIPTVNNNENENQSNPGNEESSDENIGEDENNDFNDDEFENDNYLGSSITNIHLNETTNPFAIANTMSYSENLKIKSLLNDGEIETTCK